MPNNVAKGFIPEIWDAQVYRTLEDNLVMKKIIRGGNMTAVKGFGDTIYFTSLADPSITNYTGTLTHEDLIDDQIAMLIDHEKTFAFKVRDEDSLMANVDLPGSQAQREAYNLKQSVETDFFQNIYTSATAGTVTATVTSATVLSSIAEMAQKLKEQNVPQSNMWIVIPPWVETKLRLAGVAFQINTGINGTGGMAWTNELGFDLYVTNTLYESASTPVTKVLAGSYQSIGYADKQLSTRRIELEGSRAVGIDGGLIYGYKVIKPKELALGSFTYAPETAI
jgi:hypothetical protein